MRVKRLIHSLAATGERPVHLDYRRYRADAPRAGADLHEWSPSAAC